MTSPEGNTEDPAEECRLRMDAARQMLTYAIDGILETRTALDAAEKLVFQAQLWTRPA